MTGGGGERRRLSFLRVLFALILLLGVVAGAGALVLRRVHRAAAAAASDPLVATWVAPYVDVTALPTYSFQDPAYDPARQVVLGFVVADHARGCVASWGGVDTLDEAAVGLDLDRRVVQYRERGGQVIVSFGGRDNEELAETCDDPSSLEVAYADVLHRYAATTADFDIEGSDLADTVAMQRRAQALEMLQQKARAAGDPIAVWLTLPVAPGGLPPDALDAVATMLSFHVELAGVNLLAMDFGDAAHPVHDMLSATESALLAAHGQLAALYRQQGMPLDPQQVWNHLGVTVMIGENDVTGELFTLADARQVAALAAKDDLARVSTWSLNRDSACGTYYAELGVLSDDCSGVSQTSLQFASTLAAALPAAAPAGKPAPFPATVADDPATAPYPIWQPSETYETGYKVVWQGEVYQAKWFNGGQAPDTPVQYAYQTPWLLVGPVLPGDRAPTTTTLPAGTYPAWNPKGAYEQGARVLMDGLPYEARWYTEGIPPNAYPSDPSASPWEALYTLPGEPPPTP